MRNSAGIYGSTGRYKGDILMLCNCFGTLVFGSNSLCSTHSFPSRVLYLSLFASQFNGYYLLVFVG